MMAEWHLPPDYIVANWTDELLNLMVSKLVERKKPRKEPGSRGGSGEVSDELFFARARNLIKWVRN